MRSVFDKTTISALDEDGGLKLIDTAERVHFPRTAVSLKLSSRRMLLDGLMSRRAELISLRPMVHLLAAHEI